MPTHPILEGYFGMGGNDSHLHGTDPGELRYCQGRYAKFRWTFVDVVIFLFRVLSRPTRQDLIFLKILSSNLPIQFIIDLGEK